ncbi:MAG: hypothetical protein RMK51_08365 [Meiothermus sp.]|uniref:hypothetical protein n=1 Tax=Meiothermus sp. TaxID=1955249 RepID=UPI0025CE170E|nr:hypothetical protein [Meiothermus sp.]MCS7069572.1 hypothetical protein [Meiothermus sp.]MDW8425934.1 hypothetical protein [Meiothermus sp.]
MNALRFFLMVGCLLLPGCRYTFVPLDPGRAVLPDRVSLSGNLERIPGGALAKLTVRRLAEPGYLELRWYKGDQLFQERSVWVEKPGTYEARFDRLDEGYYRLMVLVQNSPVLQLELGTPFLPPSPAPPPGSWHRPETPVLVAATLEPSCVSLGFCYRPARSCVGEGTPPLIARMSREGTKPGWRSL